MKNISICCIVFLLIYLDRIEAPDPNLEDPEKPPEPEEKTAPMIVRAPVPVTNILSRLNKLEKSLQMEGEIEKIDSTKKETLWINRLLQTIENWLTVITAVPTFESYHDGYIKVMEKMWDGCFPNSEKNPIQIRYRKNVEETDPEADEIYAYNFIPHEMCVSGLGLGTVNVKRLEIYFKRSKNKKKTTTGEKVFRKDRFYDLQVEITVPWITIRFDHEIIQWGEKPDPKEIKLQDGIMRVQLNDVKIGLSIQLQEIDKRFVKKNSDTGLTYYFCLPKLTDVSLSVNNIQRFNNEIQKKKGPEGEYVGKGINQNRAEKIIVDLTDLFETTKGREEIIQRLTPVLINRSAEAIMTSPDIMTVPINVALAWDKKEPTMPIATWEDDEIKLLQEAFYVAYTLLDLVAKALNLMVVHMQNCLKGKIEYIDFLGKGPPKNYDLGGLDVHDNGFDFIGKPEVPEKKST